MVGYGRVDLQASAELDPEVGVKPSECEEDELRSSLESLSEMTPLLQAKTARNIGKLWLRKRHSQFWEDIHLSVRAAVFATVVGLPLLFPRGHVWLIDVLVERGIYNSGVVVMFIYTLYKSVGETVKQAWQGITGTLWAAVVIWVMYGVFEEGVTDTTPDIVLYFGFAVLAAFIVLTLWLNVSLLFQIFALCNFVYFAMAFVDGNESTSRAYNKAFGLQVRQGSAISGLLVAVVGCAIAVLATLVPYPLLSIWKARDLADRLTAETCLTWDNCVRFYCSPLNAVYQRDHLARDLNHLQEEGTSLAGHIDSAWWECFGFGPWQRARLLLMRHKELIFENHDRLCCMMSLVMHETWEESHSQLMLPMASFLSAVTDEARALYEMVAFTATNGGIKNIREEDAMKLAIVRVKAASRALTRAFHKTKKDTGLADLNMEQVDEHAFCFNICAYGRLACDVAEELIGHSQGKKSFEAPPRAWGAVFAELFDREVLLDSAHLNFLLRNGIMISLCFLIGFCGYYKTILPHNANIAGTAAILLSKVGGSAVSKNLDRLQGLILGTVVGQTVYMLLGWCTWYHKLSVVCVAMLWNTGSVYMYLNSRKYATVGCLLAAFGTENFLRLCSNEPSNLPNQTYYSIINCVVAIFVIIAVDTVFADRSGGRGSRASDRTYASYVAIWRSLIALVSDLMDPEVVCTQADTRVRLTSKINFLQVLNTQAVDEPRFWRTPWMKSTFADGIACATSLRLTICGMEYAVADTLGGPKTANYRKMLALPSFAKIKNGILGSAEQLESFLGVFVHETEDTMPALRHVSKLKCWSLEVTAAVEEFMQEALASKTFALDPECDTLEDDPLCEASLLLSCIDNMASEMREFKESIIRGDVGP